MKFTTRILAISPTTGCLTEWSGEVLDLEVDTVEEAQDWCNKNKGYLMVTGEFVEEVPATEQTWKNIYERVQD